MIGKKDGETENILVIKAQHRKLKIEQHES